MFLKFSQNSLETSCAKASFSTKLQTKPTTLLKKRFRQRCFCVNLAKFLKIYFFAEDVRTINCFLNSHKKRKDSQETWVVLLIFSLELEISGVAVQSIHQNSEKWWLLGGIAKWKWLWGCFSHFLLLWPWCQGFWGSSEDRYRSKRVSQMLLVCYNLLNSQNIPSYQSVK